MSELTGTIPLRQSNMLLPALVGFFHLLEMCNKLLRIRIVGITFFNEFVAIFIYIKIERL